MSGYESFWTSEVLSDVEVVLIEDAEELGTKRKQDVTISSHRMVLACNSEYFKAQLVNWTPKTVTPTANLETSLNSKPQISMTVPVGQLELGQLLLKSMYQDKPDITDLSQELWLPLLVLADKYEVPKTLAAVCSAFTKCEDTITLTTVMRFYQLPESIINSQQCQPICDVAAARLQQDLGDLDLQAATERGQQLLQQLSFKALEALQASSRTSVATENTAAYVVMNWIKQQPDFHGKQQQLQRLLGLVRMAHCSPLFVATVLSTDPDVSNCLSQYELQIASLCSHGSLAQYNSVASDVVTKFPLWCSAERPKSVAPKPKHRWEVALDTIRQLHVECLASKSSSAMMLGPCYFWRGRSLALGLELSLQPLSEDSGVQSTQQASDAKTCLVVHIILKGNELGMAQISYGLMMKTRNSTNTCQLPSAQCQQIITGHAKGTLQHCILRISSSSWQDVEATLRAAHFVHSNDCLVVALDLHKLD